MLQVPSGCKHRSSKNPLNAALAKPEWVFLWADILAQDVLRIMRPYFNAYQ